MLTYYKKHEMPGGRAAVYDMTIYSQKGLLPDPHAVMDILDKNCKRAILRKEVGSKTGKKHFQVRFCLRESTTPKQCKALFNNHEETKGSHITPTSNDNRRGQAFYSYIQKDATAAGPAMKLCQYRSQEGRYLKKHLRGKWETRRPFQKTIHQMMDEHDGMDNRTIHFLADYRGGPDNRGGGIGKGILVGLAKHYLNAIQIPSTLTSGEDVLMYVNSLLKEREIRQNVILMVDMPRAQNPEHLRKFYAALEILKDGFCYDKRHRGKEWDFDAPMIWVFGNSRPPVDDYSFKRLRVWEVRREDMTLQKWRPFDPPHMPQTPFTIASKGETGKSHSVPSNKENCQNLPICPISQKGNNNKGFKGAGHLPAITRRANATPATVKPLSSNPNFVKVGGLVNAYVHNESSPPKKPRKSDNKKRGSKKSTRRRRNRIGTGKKPPFNIVPTCDVFAMMCPSDSSTPPFSGSTSAAPDFHFPYTCAVPGYKVMNL